MNPTHYPHPRAARQHPSTGIQMGAWARGVGAPDLGKAPPPFGGWRSAATVGHDTVEQLRDASSTAPQAWSPRSSAGADGAAFDSRSARRVQFLGQYDSVNDLFAAIHDGDPDAEKQLFAKVYDELRRMARGRLRWEKPGISMHTTALVHEAYFNLVGEKEAKWQNRAHFFGAAAEAMRRILVQRARYHSRQKRGGDYQRVPLHDNLAADERSLDVIALDEALRELEKLDPRKCQVVKYRYFLGLTVPETAELLNVSARTVDNDWQLAKSWLKRELSKGDTLMGHSEHPDSEDEGNEAHDP